MASKLADIEQLFNSMMQLGKIFSQQPIMSAEEKSLTPWQFSVLHQLADQPGMPMSELAQIKHLSKSSATQIIERLVKSGFVERANDTHDRRLIRLKLTPVGEKELETMKMVMFKKMQEVFSVLSQEDIQTLIRIQTKLIETLNTDSAKSLRGGAQKESNNL